MVTTDDLAGAVLVVARLDAGDAGVGGPDRPLELPGPARPCARRRDTRQRQGGSRSSVGVGVAVGLGHAVGLVGVAEAGVVAGVGEHLVEHVGVERAGVGEALPAVATTRTPMPADSADGQLLDLALVDPDLGVADAADDDLDLLAVLGPAEHRARRCPAGRLPLRPRCRRR